MKFILLKLAYDFNLKFINYYNIFKMNSEDFTLEYLINKRRPMLQFFLFKYLKYEDIVKFLLVSKDAGHLCDANKIETYSDKSDEKEI